AVRYQGQCGHRRRHADAISPRPVPGYRSVDPPGSGPCRADGTSSSVAARRHRDSRSHGAADAGVIMAVTTPVPAVFIDKDGTLIEDVPFNVDPAQVRLAPGVVEGLVLLAQSGFRLFVVSNQPGVARGYFTLDALGAVETRIAELLRPVGVELDGWYYCPHLPGMPDACDCRKPQPGLLYQAAAEHRI